MAFPILAAAIPAALQAGLGAWQAISGSKDRRNAMADAQRALALTPEYQTSPYAKRQLADAQSRLNALSPAVIAAMQAAQKQAASTTANAQRNASSGAEAISAAANAQAQMQNSLPQFMAAQAQYNANNRANYYDALGNMTNEERMRYQSRLNKYNDIVNYNMGRVGAANNALGQGLGMVAGGIGSGIMGYMNSGGFRNPTVNNMPQPLGFNPMNAYNTPAPYLNNPYAGYGY